MKKLLYILAAVLVLSLLNPAVLAAETDAVEGFATLSEAVENVEEGATLTLLRSVTEDVTVSQNLCIDLNGCSMEGTLTAAEGYTVTVKDSQTDDHDVDDGIYGKITAVSDNVVAAEGYLMINAEGVSFHKLTMQLTSVVVRPAETGLYYETKFIADKVVRENIDSYGVAMNAGAAPTEEKILADTEKKTHVSFDMETWTEKENTANSLLLKDILKPDNGYTINKRNAGISVYGAAYVRVGDTVCLGSAADYTLKEVVAETDIMWDGLDEDQKTDLLGMHETYQLVMRTWDIDNLEAAAQELYEKRALKILCIGNSFSLDSMWILEEIATAEGTDNTTLGILYHSGCSLAMHETYLLDNKKEYNYYKNENGAWPDSGGNGTATMLQGIADEDWDIVVLQQASSSSGRPATYNDDIQVIMDYVLENDKNPETVPQFAWNMTWAYPVEDDGIGEVTTNTTTAFDNYYGSDQMTMYNAICNAVESKIVPNSKFDYLMPVGTAIQNARSSYLGDPDLNRDYSHLSDLGRVIAGYTWYSILTGKQIDEVKVDAIPGALRYYKADRDAGDLVLTDDLKAIIVESVQNALKTPFAVTQSQYTTES